MHLFQLDIGTNGTLYSDRHGVYLGQGINGSSPGWSGNPVASGANDMWFPFGFTNSNVTLGFSLGDFNGVGCMK